MIADDKIRYAVADVNNDGKLDPIEYRAFLHPSSHDHMYEYEYKRKLLTHDENKDGFISLNEFTSDIPEGMVHNVFNPESNNTKSK